MAKNDSVLTMSITELHKRVGKVLDLLNQIDELLPGLLELPEEDRKHSSGRFRTGELEALSALLSIADKKPALFEALADKDNGTDPERFETNLLADRLQRIEALSALAAFADGLQSAINDTRLHLGDLSRPVLLAMYQIVKPHTKLDPSLASMAKPTLDFYGQIAKASSAARRKKRMDTE
jgi:hypothetical protein